MSEFKHLVVAKFKEGVDVDKLIKGMEQLLSEIDLVHSFEWGEDIQSHEMLRQGFTHAFLMTFKTKEDFNAFNTHPKHIEFSATFAEAIDKFVLLDFPTSLIKPSPLLPKQPNLEINENPTADKEITDNLEDHKTMD